MGLDRDEAGIYQLLVSRGMATVGELSTLLGYSRTKVYNLFDRLVSKGWVKVLTENPKTFIPLDPETVLDEKREAVAKAYSTAVEALKPVYKDIGIRLSDIAVFRGYEAFRKIEGMINGAEREVKIIATLVPTSVLGRIAGTLLEKKDLGIDVRSIFPMTENNDLASIAERLEAQIKEVPTAGMLIVDDSELYIGAVDISSASDSPTDLVGIWTGNKALVSLNSLVFDTLYGEKFAEVG